MGLKTAAILTATAASPAAAQINPNFCLLKPGICGANFLSGAFTREFDLSKMCLSDGTFYYDEDNVGHQFVVNVCGKLADECQIQQYCQTTSDTTGTPLPEGYSPVCLADDQAVLEGMVKQYGYAQACEDSQGNVSPLTPSCSKCSMMARDPTTTPPGTWGPIIEDGYTKDFSKGVQVTWPVVPMNAVQQGHPWGRCGYPQLGWQTTFIFECDCAQTSYANVDAFDQGNTLGVFLGKQGDLNADLNPDGSVSDMYNCMYTLKFKHRDACYAGYCDRGGEDSSSGMSGGSKFLIVACVFSALYLAAASFCGIKRSKETGETSDNRFCPTIALGTYAMYEYITCRTGYMGGGTIPGQDYSSNSSAYSSNSTELRGGSTAVM